MDYITVYTTHCPKCNMLEKMLKNAGIEYDTFEDVDKMVEMGLKSAPYMQVNCGELMDFKTAMNWIKEKTNG
jgi:glutaredoxin